MSKVKGRSKPLSLPPVFRRRQLQSRFGEVSRMVKRKFEEPLLQSTIVMAHMHALLDAVEAGEPFGNRVPHDLEVRAAYRATGRKPPDSPPEIPANVNELDSEPPPAEEYPPLDDVDEEVPF